MFKHLTGFAYNPSHVLHKNTVNQNHPENENRIKLSLNRIRQIQADKYVADFTNRKEELDFSLTDYMLQEIHDDGYLETLKNLEKMSQTEIDDLCRTFDSIAMTPDSFKVAHEAAAYCVTLTKKVAEGELKNAFALVRPPGHHAHDDCPQGFCVLNNVAICAQLAIEKNYAKKVLIVDFDIHHGNGTQQFFYDDERVTYLSIHRYEHGNFWPHKRYSDYDCIGRGTGRGHNINIPINENGGTHHDYLCILFTIVIPFARELQPDMIFISAGFDACIGDPIGYMDVIPEIFPHYIYQLAPMCNGKIVSILEGGYNHSAVAVCVDMCLRVMIGEKPPYFKYNKVPRASTVISCMNAIGALREYWPYVNSFYDLAPYVATAHQTVLPIFHDHIGISTTETGNINQNNLRNLLNSHTPQVIKLPTTKLYNINMEFPMYNVKNIPVDPHANQYEDLFSN
uniref:Histone deacetylase domain-containing protein n=1 Tax=Panagrolaimus sp. ES5 TaxID=591445 RepID=A0AC34GQ96_9BILA